MCLLAKDIESIIQQKTTLNAFTLLVEGRLFSLRKLMQHNISEIQVDWVYYLPDEQLSTLINNKEILRLIIRTSDQVGWAHSLQNRMLEIEKK